MPEEHNTTTTPDDVYRARYDELYNTAVQTLTAVVELKHPRSGQPDLAGFLASALVQVAADVGSAERVLAGREGSWEADHVRGLINGSVGHEGSIEELAFARTRPVVIPLNVPRLVNESVFPNPYDVELDALYAKYAAAASSEAAEQEGDEREALEQKWRRRFEEYAAKFTAAVEEEVAQMPDLRVPVTVEAITDPAARWHEDSGPDPQFHPDEFVAVLWNAAADSLPLPVGDDGPQG